jgi:hypothetical protein
MRIPKLGTIAFIFRIVRNNYFLTSTEKALRFRYARTNATHGGHDEPLVVVQCSQDYYYFGIFGELITAMRRAGPLAVAQYTVRDLRGGSSRSLRRLFWNLITTNYFSDWKWRRLYSGFAERIAYSATAWLAPWTELRLWWTAFGLWRAFENADALAALEVKGIVIGDLIIDSYLRFKPSPYLILDDVYLFMTIRQALKNLEHALRYFSSIHPDLLLTSYTTYIRHGIPARVAAKLGIRTLSFANVQQLAVEITPDNLWQTKDAGSYSADFHSLSGSDSRIAAAERILDARIKGAIDKNTIYMKASAYGKESSDILDVRGMPVLFMHDFFDSAHVYRWITFHDFWTWACFTIETLRDAGIRFALKPHPNQEADSGNVLNLLIDKYSGLNILSADTSNYQLVKSGMACAITVYGTVASEMAFMGVPTISCGDNPHVSFNFCHTARSPAEYAALLRGYRSLPADPDTLRIESCAFYYMHALHYDERDLILADKGATLRRRIFYADPPPPLSEIEDTFDQFGSGPEFDAYARELRLSL